MLILVSILEIRKKIITYNYTKKPFDITSNLSFFDSIIVEEKIILIPGVPKAFNPSIVKTKEGYLVSFRAFTRPLKCYPRFFMNTIVYRKFLKKGKISQCLGVVRFNSNFEMLGRPQFFFSLHDADGSELVEIEDARLFTTNEKILIIFNACDSTTKKQTMCLSEIIASDLDGYSFANTCKLKYDQSHHIIEKNWSLFSVSNKIYAVYEENPHTIIEIDPVTGVCADVSQVADSCSWNYGIVRGGTPGYLCDDRLLFFYHSSSLYYDVNKRKERFYFEGAYILNNKPPFEIKSMTTSPFYRSDYSHVNKKIVFFPGGYVWDEKYIYLLSGKNDCSMIMTKLDKMKLFDVMEANKN